MPEQGLSSVKSLQAVSSKRNASSAVFSHPLLSEAASLCCTGGFTTGCSFWGSFLLVSRLFPLGDSASAAGSWGFPHTRSGSCLPLCWSGLVINITSQAEPFQVLAETPWYQSINLPWVVLSTCVWSSQILVSTDEPVPAECGCSRNCILSWLWELFWP